MSLVDDLIESVHDSTERVSRIVFGRNWTVVETSATGLAPIIGGDTTPGAQEISKDLPATDLLSAIDSPNPVERSVAASTLNSLLVKRMDFATFRPSYLPRGRHKNIVVIGDAPFLGDLETVSESSTIIDPVDIGNPKCLSCLSQADIVMISSSRVPIGDLESVLRSATGAYRIIFGPATPLSPIMFDYGCSQLVGALVTDPEEIKSLLSAGMCDFSKSAGLKIVVLVKPQQSK